MTTGQNQVSGYTPAVDLGDEQLNSRIAAGMETVEDLLRSELSQGAEFITDKVLHLTTAGGKRFRPMMALRRNMARMQSRTTCIKQRVWWRLCI